MRSTQETIEILKDLIQINSHWIAGYEQAAKELHIADAELKILLQSLKEQSDAEIIELRNDLEVIGEKIKLVTSNGEKIYKAWLDIKEIFSGREKHKVLTAVEKAYQTALASENLPANLRVMIEGQKSIIKTSQNDIMSSRNRKP